MPTLGEFLSEIIPDPVMGPLVDLKTMSIFVPYEGDVHGRKRFFQEALEDYQKNTSFNRRRLITTKEAKDALIYIIDSILLLTEYRRDSSRGAYSLESHLHLNDGVVFDGLGMKVFVRKELQEVDENLEQVKTVSRGGPSPAPFNPRDYMNQFESPIESCQRQAREYIQKSIRDGLGIKVLK